MQIYWCANCYTVFHKAETCYFCENPLYSFTLEKANLRGCWEVFCSCDNKVSSSQEEQILGRGDDYTGHFFGSHISRCHAKITAMQGNVCIQHLQGKSGTFVPENRQKEGREWRRIRNEEKVLMGPGGQIRLSQECVVQVWLKWIPSASSSERHARRANNSISLRKEKTFPLFDCVHFSHRKGIWIATDVSSNIGECLHNNKLFAVVPLQEGDHLTIRKQEYEYSPPATLMPASPRYPMEIHLQKVQLKDRVYIDDLLIPSTQFVGVIGESGAGKSTLLKLLTGWLSPSSGSISIRQNNRFLRTEELRQRIIYLPQYDIVHEDLCAGSSLHYSALLRYPKKTLKERHDLVGKILSILNLDKTKNTMIKNLSGGERKRINLAQELLNEQASLIVLDEPTSGLDIGNEHKALTMMKELCRQSRTVVCTTHNLHHYDLFDTLIILSKGKDGKGRIDGKGHPQKIATDYGFRKTTISSPQKEKDKSTPKTQTRAKEKFWLHLCQRSWWVLFCRRMEEFFPPSVPLLFLVPIAIGLAIAMAKPLDGGEKRFFLCSVAVFWLAMSTSSQELRQKRYKIFLHEKSSGISSHAFTISYFLFYSLISMVQSLALISPSIYLIIKEHINYPEMQPFALTCQTIFIFISLTFMMATSGAIVGLTTSLLESAGQKLFRYIFRPPTSVTVPLITIIQLLFSEMVMGQLQNQQGYFYRPLKELRHYFYLGTFSRYTDLAYQSFHNLQRYSPEFYYNIAIFAVIALFIPCLLMHWQIYRINNKK